jgi:raffinose/stachyose/melibiose transport system permease protein
VQDTKHSASYTPTTPTWTQRWNTRRIVNLTGYVLLIGYSFIALFPIVLIFMNSFKEQREIFSSPYSLPSPFTVQGYDKVLLRADFGRYFVNSISVTLSVLLLVLLIGGMVAFALSEYKFRGNALLMIYFSLGIMIPIRLGTVSIVRLMKVLELQNRLGSLILVYTAMGLPLTIFILGNFISEIPRDLKDAARVDGASEYRIFFLVVIPLIRPALATVAVFHMVPVWNDLWWPLVLAPGEGVRTVTIGVSAFIGQFKTDYSAMIAALSLGMLPVLALYAIFSRQLIRGLSAGAVKA